MKRVSGFLMAAVFLAACKTSDKKAMTPEERRIDSLKMVEKQKLMEDTANYTTIQWLDSTFIAAGKVKDGKQVEIAFRFKNTGDKPLVFTNVSARCGCTVADKPKEPISPGDEGVIIGKFDSKDRPGINRKQIEVTSNTKPTGTFLLEFEVIVE